jgi:hypothetical protein
MKFKIKVAFLSIFSLSLIEKTLADPWAGTLLVGLPQGIASPVNQITQFSASATHPLPTSTFDTTTIPSGVNMQLAGFFSDPTSPLGTSEFVGYVPLSNFATSSALSNSIGTLQSQFAAVIQNINNQMRASSAMASAFTPLLPADGKTNELNYATSTLGGKLAVSLNYSHVFGDVNVIAAAAISGPYAAGKFGMGVSW